MSSYNTVNHICSGSSQNHVMGPHPGQSYFHPGSHPSTNSSSVHILLNQEQAFSSIALSPYSNGSLDPAHRHSDPSQSFIDSSDPLRPSGKLPQTAFLPVRISVTGSHPDDSPKLQSFSRSQPNPLDSSLLSYESAFPLSYPSDFQPANGVPSIDIEKSSQHLSPPSSHEALVSLLYPTSVPVSVAALVANVPHTPSFSGPGASTPLFNHHDAASPSLYHRGGAPFSPMLPSGHPAPSASRPPPSQTGSLQRPFHRGSMSTISMEGGLHNSSMIGSSRYSSPCFPRNCNAELLSSPAPVAMNWGHSPYSSPLGYTGSEPGMQVYTRSGAPSYNTTPVDSHLSSNVTSPHSFLHRTPSRSEILANPSSVLPQGVKRGRSPGMVFDGRPPFVSTPGHPLLPTSLASDAAPFGYIPSLEPFDGSVPVSAPVLPPGGSYQTQGRRRSIRLLTRSLHMGPTSGLAGLRADHPDLASANDAREPVPSHGSLSSYYPPSVPMTQLPSSISHLVSAQSPTTLKFVESSMYPEPLLNLPLPTTLQSQPYPQRQSQQYPATLSELQTPSYPMNQQPLVSDPLLAQGFVDYAGSGRMHTKASQFVSLASPGSQRLTGDGHASQLYLYPKGSGSVNAGSSNLTLMPSAPVGSTTSNPSSMNASSLGVPYAFPAPPSRVYAKTDPHIVPLPKALELHHAPAMGLPPTTSYVVNPFPYSGNSVASQKSLLLASRPSDHGISTSDSGSKPKRRKNSGPTFYPPNHVRPASPQALKTPVQQSCDDKDGHYIVKPNDILASQYRIIRLLGQGTFGKVVEATDGEGKKYAIKIIRSTPKYREASRVEVRVLEHIKREDPTNSMQCIQLRKFFEYKHHSCMVFDLLSQSVFDFLKDNHFNPFPPEHIFRFTKQIVTAVAFLHRNELVHTDLKPENIMLNDNSYTLSTTDIGRDKKPKKLLKNATIQLIDFGSAVFEREYHSTVVSTRHYRAPEVILNLGWSYPCDMWSVGCILVEFWTGDALFQTHDNLEHLAMMEQVLGRFPLSMIEKSSVFQKYFNADGSVSHPKEDTTKTSINNVRRMKRISDIIKVKRNDDFAFRFLDLVSRMLTPDPKERITAQDALHHSFFSLYPGC